MTPKERRDNSQPSPALEILKKFGPKLGKFVSRLKLKLETWKKLELIICLNSKLPSLMKIEFDKK